MQKPRRLARFPQHLKTQDIRYYPLGCHSFVMVMQTAHFRQLADCPQFRWLNRSRLRCIHFQRLVCPLMVTL